MPGLISADLVGGRRAHLEDHVRPGPQRGGAVGDLRAGRAVGVIAEVGAIAGPVLDGDRETQLDQLLDDFGNGGDALLARKYFPRDSDGQGHGNLGNSLNAVLICGDEAEGPAGVGGQ